MTAGPGTSNAVLICTGSPALLALLLQVSRLAGDHSPFFLLLPGLATLLRPVVYVGLSVGKDKLMLERGGLAPSATGGLPRVCVTSLVSSPTPEGGGSQGCDHSFLVPHSRKPPSGFLRKASKSLPARDK